MLKNQGISQIRHKKNLNPELKNNIFVLKMTMKSGLEKIVSSDKDLPVRKPQKILIRPSYFSVLSCHIFFKGFTKWRRLRRFIPFSKFVLFVMLFFYFFRGFTKWGRKYWGTLSGWNESPSTHVNGRSCDFTRTCRKMWNRYYR